MEIDIKNYLSFDEQKELAVEVFKDRMAAELFKSNKGTVVADSEVQRIIGNISHQIVMDEVQKYIPDAEQMIKDKVRSIITESTLSYEIFKRKDVWDKEESLAVKYINETVAEYKDTFKQRIRDVMDGYDVSGDVARLVSEEFGQMADSMLSLSDLFHGKSKGE